jgi:ABC-type branched-subunit amino acid transport system substrate-binding protein
MPRDIKGEIVQHRSARVFIALVVVTLAACTSPTSNKSSNGGGPSGPANTVGITPDSVTVSLVVADLSILSKQHLAPDLGDPVKAANAVVEEINAKGGVAGHKIVLKPHTIANAPIATQALLQKVCTQATEEDKPLAVITAPAVPQPIVECSAVTHDQLAIAMDSWPQKLYDDAKGRIFSVASGMSVSIDRMYAFVPTLMKEKHFTDGKTLGMINQDQPADRTAAGNALKKSLAGAGLTLAAETTVPLPDGSQTCSQPDVAIQDMKNHHVNLVFLVAQALCAASIVEAADKANYKPQWVTLGNNVTDTVAQFMAPAKNNYDGAIGIGSVFPDATKEAVDCNEIVARRANLHYAPGSDPYGFVAVICIQIQTLANAIAAAKAPLSQGSVMTALSAMTSVPMNVGPPGSLSATKHDAGDFVFLEKYSAAQGKFVPTDTTPQRVP